MKSGSQKKPLEAMENGSEKELKEAFRKHRHRCNYDFEYVCAKELVIDRKGGDSPVPFIFNRSQKYV
jgi:hypothetical protein